MWEEKEELGENTLNTNEKRRKCLKYSWKRWSIKKSEREREREREKEREGEGEGEGEEITRER